jgi:uncharacterized Rossmann fold enzyme
LNDSRKRQIDLASPDRRIGARDGAKKTLQDAPVAVEVIVTDRKGNILARTDFA